MAAPARSLPPAEPPKRPYNPFQRGDYVAHPRVMRRAFRGGPGRQRKLMGLPQLWMLEFIAELQWGVLDRSNPNQAKPVVSAVSRPVFDAEMCQEIGCDRKTLYHSRLDAITRRLMGARQVTDVKSEHYGAWEYWLLPDQWDEAPYYDKAIIPRKGQAWAQTARRAECENETEREAPPEDPPPVEPPTNNGDGPPPSEEKLIVLPGRTSVVPLSQAINEVRFNSTIQVQLTLHLRDTCLFINEIAQQAWEQVPTEHIRPGLNGTGNPNGSSISDEAEKRNLYDELRGIMEASGRPVTVRQHPGCWKAFGSFLLETGRRILDDARARRSEVWDRENNLKWVPTLPEYLDSRIWDTAPVRSRPNRNASNGGRKTTAQMIDEA